MIHRDDKSSFVYVLNARRASRRAVETGLTSNGRVEILSGIDDRTRVIAASSPELKAGASVRPADNIATPRQIGDQEDGTR